MHSNIQGIRETIEPLRQQIINHPVYAEIKDISDLRIFMKYHVYAVWDFMSLLKTLQNQLTCTQVPWYPKGDAETRYLINEIVAGEESDVDPNGTRISHFELYLSAMQQSAASTQEIETFIAQLQQGKAFADAYAAAQTPSAAQEFVDFTFSTIHSNKAHVQAAIFTFGREDLIPGMFISLVQDIHKAFPDQVSLFKYYLDRHIEIDGDHHSHLALRMTESLCTTAQHWQEAEEATIQSLNKRIALWNGALHEIVVSKRPAEHF